MKRIFRTVHFFSNIAVIVIALLFAFVVVKQYLLPTSIIVENQPKEDSRDPIQAARPKSPTDNTPVGKLVPVEDIDWKGNERTLLLYISSKCRYCTESVPFYKRLVREASDKGIPLVAVLPQPVDEARKYLKDHDLNIKTVLNTSISSIGVTATPTLMLVKSDGTVSDYWRGRLQADKENEVLSKLN